MREAIEALAKSRTQASRFASTAAKRTVAALQSGCDGNDESDESDEDSDDEENNQAALAAHRNGDKAKQLERHESLETLDTQSNHVVQVRTENEIIARNPAHEHEDSDKENENSLSRDLPTHGVADQGPVSQGTLKEGPSSDSKLVRIYIVNISRTINGEEQPVEELIKLLNYSDANALAEEKVSECQLDHSTACTRDYVDQLFRCDMAHDDKNSTQIWVASEIISVAKIPNFEAGVVKERLPSSSWFLRFRTTQDVWDEESKTMNICITAEILPDHHYSDVELANHAACEYLIKYAKPSRPVMNHLEQYENEFIPLVRQLRDDLCEEQTPFACGLEKNSSQCQWLAVKEVDIQVVCYQMKGPLN